jgi:hypothetical protein
VKLGAENKKQIIIMVVLLAILLAVGIYDFARSGDTSAAPPVASSTATSAASSKPAIQGKKTAAPSAQNNNLDPTLHLNVLEASRRVKYEPGRNIFRMEEPPPPKVDTSVRAANTPPPTPTPTPPQPPIPLKFYVFQNKSNADQKQIFLAEGDVVFVAKQGDIIDRRYRVVSIQKTSVTIEDVLTNNKQDIQLRSQQ